MDPDVLLAALRSAQSDYEDTRGRANPLSPEGVDAADRMRDAIFAMDEWLSRDGFLPHGWMAQSQQRQTVDRASAPDYAAIADGHFADMIAANAAEPYDHREYTRHLNMARAACLLLADGDLSLGAALVDAFHDSNESMRYYLARFTRAELLDLARIGDGNEQVPHHIQFHTH